MKHNIKIYKTMIQLSMISSTIAFYYEFCKSGRKKGVGWEATLNQGDSPLIPWRLSCMTRADYSHQSNHYNQGIINMNRHGNFCKGTWVSKVITETKVDARVEQQKKLTGFSRMSVMANLLCFGCFAAG